MDNGNPALHAFCESFQSERVWGQVLISREGAGFSLKHAVDGSLASENLKRVPLADLRKIATYNSDSQFRPLRAAPDLVRGWVCDCRSVDELWRAIQDIYPGSIPDWYATRQSPVPVTDYRAFTNRQSGMYRITQLLSDAQAAQVIRACCPVQFCLKRRFWTVNGLPPDSDETKSGIPCLEPCALLLELARKAVRIEQEDRVDVQFSRSDLETLVTAAKRLLESGRACDRIGDIGSAINPRRLQLVVEKYGGSLNGSANQEEE